MHAHMNIIHARVYIPIKCDALRAIDSTACQPTMDDKEWMDLFDADSAKKVVNSQILMILNR